MEGQSVYNDIIDELRTRLKADGIALIVFNGERGHGAGVTGTLEAGAEIASIMDQLAEGLRQDVERSAAEHGVTLQEHDERVPSTAAEVLKMSWEVIGLIQERTKSWDEALHVLAFALGGLRASREAFAGDGDLNYAKNRIDEVLDYVLNKLTLVAYTTQDPAEAGLKLTDKLPDNFRN